MLLVVEFIAWTNSVSGHGMVSADGSGSDDPGSRIITSGITGFGGDRIRVLLVSVSSVPAT